MNFSKAIKTLREEFLLSQVKMAVLLDVFFAARESLVEWASSACL